MSFMRELALFAGAGGGVLGENSLMAHRVRCRARPLRRQRLGCPTKRRNP